jgi:hypothetical protein
MPVNGSKFEHACFISYKHPPKTASYDHFYREFVEAFRERLDYFLATEIRVYLDLDADPGSSYPTELSQKLCKSVCMVAVMVPEYRESSWCQAEWEAMKKLEAQRLGPGQIGLIIPIALRRTADEWNSVLKRKPVDFSKVSVPKSQLKSAKHSEKIKAIAEIINNFVQQVTDTCVDCNTFAFPVGHEVLESDPTFTDPNPFK